MRSLRLATAIFVVLWGASYTTSFARQNTKGLPNANALLELRPKFIQNFEYDTPSDPAAVSACKVENVLNDQNRSVGYTLRDAQGKLLRRFVIAHGSRIDQWSYYQDGFEVYREEDLDGDRALDECRWLNAGGTRIARIAKGQITSWKQITAEEASKVLVQALAAGDLHLLETVMATPEELTNIGATKEIVASVAGAKPKRDEAVGALEKKLIGWNKQTIWNRFDGTFPHVIPADPTTGLAKDLTLYENAMVIPGSISGDQNPAKLAFLQVPDVIQLGPVWKFVELPHAIDPEKPIVAAVSGIRSLLLDKDNSMPPRDEAVEAALKALADYDVQNAALLQGGEGKKIAKYNLDRVPFLRALVKVSKKPEDQINYNKQIIDSLVAAFRTGEWPQGKKAIDKIIADGDKVGSYAAYSMIDAEFAMESNAPNANVLANQKKWMADLEAFMGKFPNSDEVPAVLLHLAKANEFNAEEKKAREQYGALVKDYAATEAGRKATGALRRLDLAGQTLSLKGSGPNNETVLTSTYLGKPLLIVFWASWASPCVADLPELLAIYEKYHRNGFEVIGINVDTDRVELENFLKKHKLTWPQIFEPGGMDSRLAVDFGIISLPTMFLVDAQGKVVRSSVRVSELEKQLEKLLGTKEPGVADLRH